MPKDLISVVTIVLMSVFIISSSVTFATEDARHSDLVQSMQQSIEQAAMQSFDYSSRVHRGDTQIDKSSFEKNFKKDFSRNKDINLSNYSLTFSYLKDGVNTKAIRVKMKDDRGTTYTATVAVDVNNS